MNTYVLYGKIVEDKENGVYLAGVYFGGIARDLDDAESVAKWCIANIKGGTIVPKIFQADSIKDAINMALPKFNEMEKHMIEVEDIITRSKSIKR